MIDLSLTHLRIAAAVLVGAGLLVSVPARAEPDPTPAPLQEKMVVAPKIPDFKPKSREERDMLLGDLYKKLATTEHRVVAEAVAKAIEKLRAITESDTTALLAQRANKATTEKNFELASKFAGIMLELDPEFAEGWFLRAVQRTKSADHQGAFQDLQRALALDPNHYDAIALLAMVLKDIGDEKKAMEALKKLKAVHPHFLEINPVGTLIELEKKAVGQGI